MAVSALLSDPLLQDVPVREGYKVLGGVVLFKKLGQGGMGAVYKGKHLRLGVDVALKVMAPPSVLSSAQVENFVQRFVREAKTSAAVRHPNLIRVYDINAESGIYYIIMDFVDGESAADRLNRKEHFSEQEALEICLGAAKGLGGAHKKGIVHRDVKPDNILVDKQGNVVIADLGLAKAFIAGEGSSIASLGVSMSQQAMGTPYFMSPEQTRSAKEVGPQADVWSLGVTLYHLLAGSHPWKSSDFAEVMLEIRDSQPASLAEIREDVSEGTLTIIKRAMAKEPGERFSDCSQMAKALSAQLHAVRASGDSILADGDAGNTVMVLVDDEPPDYDTLTLLGDSIGLAADTGAKTPGTLVGKLRARPPWMVATVAGGVGAILLALVIVLASLLRGDASEPESAAARNLRERAMTEKAAVLKAGALLLESDTSFADAEVQRLYEQALPMIEAGEYYGAIQVLGRAAAAASDEEDRSRLRTLVKWAFLKRYEQLEETGEWAKAEDLAREVAELLPDSALVAYLYEKARGENLPERARELLAKADKLRGQKRYEEAIAAYEEVRPLLNEYHGALVDAIVAQCKSEAFKLCYSKAKKAFEKGEWMQCLEFLASAESYKAGNPLVADLRDKAAVACLDGLAGDVKEHIARGRWQEASGLLAHAQELGVNIRMLPGYEEIRASLDLRDEYDGLVRLAIEAAEREDWQGVLSAADRAKALYPDDEFPEALADAVSRARKGIANAKSAEDDDAFAAALALVERVEEDPSEALAALEKYLEDWPAGRHVAEAKQAMIDVCARADDNAFASAKSRAEEAGEDYDRATASYASYLGRHAAGRHAGEAFEAISRLRKAKDDAAFAAAEGAARDAGDDREKAVAAYAGYLEAYPAGLHAGEAEKRIAELTPRATPAAEPGAEALADAIDRGSWDEAFELLEDLLGRSPASEALKALEAKLREYAASQATPVATIALEMQYVPGGRFTMGSEDGEEDEQPVGVVRVDGFSIGRCEITNAQFELFQPEHVERRSRASPDNEHPAVNVSWEEAVAFCEWLSEKEGARYRLPTEAEWELAARGRDGRKYPWGNEEPGASKGLANWGEGDTPETRGIDGHVFTAPVGSYPAGASPYGCMDMAGNAWEWCTDWYDSPYERPEGDVVNPTGPGYGREKVIRGGCWFHDADSLRCANRLKKKPTIRSDLIGFRVAREVEVQE